jgi:hypothetical protein
MVQSNTSSIPRTVEEDQVSRKSSRHVVPSREGGWDVVAPAAQLATSHRSTQQAAIDRARDIVRNERGGEVV